MPACPNSIIEHRKPVSKVNLSRKPIEESEIHFCENEYDIFVEIVADHPANSSISPSSMYE
jgi:hypothetical protein